MPDELVIPSCSVCGQSAPGRHVRDSAGRVVCEACITHARDVLLQRAARQRRAEHAARTQALVQQAEADNTLVLDLRDEDALRRAAHACPGCGRFLDLRIEASPDGCDACGFGASAQPTSRWTFKARKGRRGPVQPAQGQIEAALAALDARLVFLLPWGLCALLVWGGVAGLFTPWARSAAALGAVVYACALVGLTLFITFAMSLRTGLVWSGCLVALAAGWGVACTMSASPARGVLVLIAALGTWGAALAIRSLSGDRSVRHAWLAMGTVGTLWACVLLAPLLRQTP